MPEHGLDLFAGVNKSGVENSVTEGSKSRITILISRCPPNRFDPTKSEVGCSAGINRNTSCLMMSVTPLLLPYESRWGLRVQ